MTLYVLRNRANGKLYVGQTKNAKMRFKDYRRCSGSAIHNAVARHGWDCFQKHLFGGVPLDFIDELEIEMIGRLKTIRPNGYNIGAGGNGKRLFTEETRRKMSMAAKAKFIAHPELIEKLREGARTYQTGTLRTEETKRKQSLAAKGKPKPLEARLNMSIAARRRVRGCVRDPRGRFVIPCGQRS